MKSRSWILLSLALLLGSAPSAQAAEHPMRFGLEGNWADDADLGVGVRLQVGLADVHPGLRGAASFDYFFPDDGAFGLADVDVTYWEANANLTYTLRGRLAPYVGAG